MRQAKPVHREIVADQPADRRDGRREGALAEGQDWRMGQTVEHVTGPWTGGLLSKMARRHNLGPMGRAMGAARAGGGLRYKNGDQSEIDFPQPMDFCSTPCCLVCERELALSAVRRASDAAPHDSLPLYCSDRCRLSDLGIQPHNMAPEDPVRDGEWKESPSMQILAQAYNWEPLPPPIASADGTKRVSDQPEHFSSGTMIQAKYIEQASNACKAAPRSNKRYDKPSKPKIMAGWNDGSQGWRQHAYSSKPSSAKNSFDGDLLPPVSSTERSYAAAPASAPSSSSSDSAFLISQYSASFTHARRVAASAPCHSLSTSPPKRAHVVPSSVEGKLLLPDVMKPSRRDSSTSLASYSSLPSPTKRTFSVESMMSHASSESDRFSKSPRPVESKHIVIFDRGSRSSFPLVTDRSWSYDGMKTYDVMPYPKNWKGSSQKLFIFSGKC
jgi:hypothetical protein